MDNKNLLDANSFTDKTITNEVIIQTRQRLEDNGWVLLRGFDTSLTVFSEFITLLCSRLTFDPARQSSNPNTQKVDAGTQEIGLHIENGNTPFPPDIIAFYSKKSAAHGSQTTVCDGHKLYHAMSDDMRELFSQQMTVSRTLPELLWKRYAANEHPAIESYEQVDSSHLEDILSISPNHRGSLNADNSLNYTLDIQPCITSPLSGVTSFANALLGPSFNYQPPVYRFKNNDLLCEQLKLKLALIAEQQTLEIDWCDGDIAVIDNKRTMHGRREITDAASREIHIAMGMV